MKYWIITNGVTEGPLTFEQLLERNLPPQTPVWRSGLADWTYMSQLPELNGQRVEMEVVTVANPEEPQPQQAHGTTPPPLDAPASRNTSTPHPWQGDRRDTDGSPAPTYLGLSIAATLLCCTVLGIVAIVYAVRVRDENARGFYEEAHRDSRKLELWLMASITFGLVSLPFSIVMAMLG